MRWQLRVLQVPRRGAGAFLPIPGGDAQAATNGQNLVSSTLGAVPVPTPRPPAMRVTDYGPNFQGSYNGPDWMRPSIGVVHLNSTMRFPGRLFGHRPTPVPSAAIGAVPTSNSMKTRIGGRTVTANPRPFTQWPTYSGKG